MKKISLLIATLFLLQMHLSAQQPADKDYIIQQTNVKALQEISKKAKDHYLNNLARHKKNNTSLTILNSQNEVGYLSGFDEEGNPVYDFDSNENVARTGRVDRIRVGGTSGLDLDGTDIEIGHWEAGGLALTSHQELEGRITHMEQADVSSHSTHTAGTMLASGILENARGMASNAKIFSRRSNSDDSEIADFAANGGILSNHSYSTGNPDGDLLFYGKYTFNSGEWDEIMYEAPYLTMCKSAGNNRNDGVNTGDGGYDIIYTVAACKNLITVGAVHNIIDYTSPASVQQSGFNNWGPTDDWRIKPDITTNGVTVYSSDNGTDSDYDYKSGTSMSTAAMTGTIALLQQHYHNLNTVYMKSATVKALLLCTTDEAGDHDGPDFQSGWGLLNAERAAEVISQNPINSKIDELSLAETEIYTTIVKSDGSKPMNITIAWTDRQASQVAGTDNQTPMLTNDLDLRVSNDNITYEPWVMTPNADSNNFTDAAEKGDNFRDNVERIDIASPPEGLYTITVSHKGSLADDKQDFSLVINGIVENPVALNHYESNPLSVFPNPAKEGDLKVIVPDNKSSKSYTLFLYDLKGQLISSEVFYSKQIDLQVGHLVSGSYVVVVQTEHGFYRELILID